MIRIPREVRYENRRRYHFELFEPEAEFLKSLLREEIEECNKSINNASKRGSAPSQTKVREAYYELIEEYEDLIRVLEGQTVE